MHPSARTLHRFSENIPLLELPAVENMWDTLVCWIHSKIRKYDKIVELKDAIIEAWNTIDDKIIKKKFHFHYRRSDFQFNSQRVKRNKLLKICICT